MAIVVIGGQASKVGKTTVIEQIIRALPQLHWTAFKITPHVHRLRDLPFSITEEHDASAATDTSRFLAAGAMRSFLVHATNGHLEKVLPNLRNGLTRSTNSIIESNSIMKFLQPDLSLIVLDPLIEDFKDSAGKILELADALVWTSKPADAHLGWPPHAATIVKGRLQFVLEENYEISCELLRWVAERLSASRPGS